MNLITKKLAITTPFFMRKKLQKNLITESKKSVLFLTQISKDVMIPANLEPHIIALMDKGLS